MFEESSVIEVVSPHVPYAPELLFASSSFSVQQWLPGQPLVDLIEPGESLPVPAMNTIVSLAPLLGEVPWEDMVLLEPTSRFFAAPITASTAFSRQLTRWLSRVYQWCAPLVGPSLRAQGITTNPFATSLTLNDPNRPLRLSHGDTGPHNCLWDGHALRIIDWELALVADPAYDIASLLHRFTLNDTDTRHLMASALSEVPLKRRADYVTDVHAYRAQEEMRSKVFATIRSNLFTPPSSDDTKLRLGELARANEITGT